MKQKRSGMSEVSDAVGTMWLTHSQVCDACVYSPKCSSLRIALRTAQWFFKEERKNPDTRQHRIQRKTSKENETRKFEEASERGEKTRRLAGEWGQRREDACTREGEARSKLLVQGLRSPDIERAVLGQRTRFLG